MVLLGQRQVIRYGRDDGDEIAGQRLPMRAFASRLWSRLNWPVRSIVRIQIRLALFPGEPHRETTTIGNRKKQDFTLLYDVKKTRFDLTLF